jgi:ABC-2 type transport system permease protein
LGAVINLPLGSPQLFFSGSVNLLITACLVILTLTPFAFFASAGRGYLLPLGLAMLALVLANVMAIIGWGGLFPWSIPALYAGMGAHAGLLDAGSYAVVAVTALVGVLGTYAWWMFADQNR